MKMYDKSLGVLDEAIIPTITKALKRARSTGELRKAFGEVAANDVRALEKIVAGGKVKTIEGATIGTIDDLAKALRSKKIAPAQLGAIRTGLIKDVTVSSKVRTKLIDDFTNQSSVQKAYNNMTDAEIGTRLKKLGYDKSSRQEIIGSLKKKGIGKNAPVPPPPGTPPPPGSTTPPPAGGIPPIPGKKPLSGALRTWVLANLGVKSIFFLVQAGLVVFVGSKALRWWRNAKAKYGKKLQGPITLPPCIYDLLATPGCELIQEQGPPDDTGPTMVLAMKKTGNREYDKAGGLKFYMDGSLSTGDGKHKGRWSCQGGKVSIEESEGLSDIFEELLIEEELEFLLEDVRGKRIDRAVDIAVERLQGDITAKDFRKVLRKIRALGRRKYQGQNALVTVMNRYAEKTGSNLINDIQSQYKGLDLQSQELRGKLLNILQKKTGGEVGGGLKGLDIAWDDGWKPAGGETLPIGTDASTSTETPTTEPTTNEKPATGGTVPVAPESKYTKKVDYPFVFGDKNDRIREIQSCLGLERKYQTGNFGPITRDALKKGNYGETITPEVYKAIMSKCGQTTQTTQAAEPTTQATTQTKAPERIEPVAKAQTAQIQAPNLSQVNTMKLAPIAQQQMLAKNQPKAQGKTA